MYLFANDICGESESPPRHARAFGDLAKYYRLIEEECVAAFTKFKKAAAAGDFPNAMDTSDHRFQLATTSFSNSLTACPSSSFASLCRGDELKNRYRAELVALLAGPQDISLGRLEETNCLATSTFLKSNSVARPKK